MRDILKDAPEFLKELDEFFPRGLFREFYEEFYSADINMPDETYEDLLYQVFNQVLRNLDWGIEDIEEKKKKLSNLSKKVNDQLVRLTKTEELRETLKEYTERMNDLNAKTAEYLERIDSILEYLKRTRGSLVKEMQRKGIKIRE